MSVPLDSLFSFRPASVAASDHELFVDFQESQIPWLTSVGSGGQWGTTSIRQKNPTQSDRPRAWIERSEITEQHPQWSESWCRAFVAEAKDGTPVAGLVLDSRAAAYVRAVLPEQDDSDPFIYVDYLLSNRDARDKAKGSGAALIAFAKEQARGVGIKRLCLDCYRGNDRKLIKYYQSQGFVAVGDFAAPKHDEEDWPGCVMEMRF